MGYEKNDNSIWQKGSDSKDSQSVSTTDTHL